MKVEPLTRWISGCIFVSITKSDNFLVLCSVSHIEMPSQIEIVQASSEKILALACISIPCFYNIVLSFKRCRTLSHIKVLARKLHRFVSALKRDLMSRGIQFT